MNETQKQELCGQLRTAGTSLAFLVLLILSICLSWQGTAIQREGLFRVLLGEEKESPTCSTSGWWPAPWSSAA